jgi:hypothetical protein
MQLKLKAPVNQALVTMRIVDLEMRLVASAKAESLLPVIA